MSLGYSVGDFIAIGALAWNVYKSCRDAPESFAEISSEVLSLYAVLKEAEETVFAQPLPLAQQERLKAVGDGCNGVLKDLQHLVTKYRSLGPGTQVKGIRDRVMWGAENVSELRARLTSNTALLAAWISTSQVRVLKKLDEYLQEVKQGKHRDSTISLQTQDSLSLEDRNTWRTIRKELEDIGINVEAFESNKDFIFGWFAKAVDNGEFKEQTLDNFLPHGEQLEASLSEITETLTLDAKEFSNSIRQVEKTSREATKPPFATTNVASNTASSLPHVQRGSGRTRAPAAAWHAIDHMPSLDDLYRSLVKFHFLDESCSFMVNVANCADGGEIAEKVLRRHSSRVPGNWSSNSEEAEKRAINKMERAYTEYGGLIIDGWSVFLGTDLTSECLSEHDIMTFCRTPPDGAIQPRELTLRRYGSVTAKRNKEGLGNGRLTPYEV